MDAMIEDFALYLLAEGKKAKTVRVYTYAIRQLQDSQGIYDWHKVTRTQVRKHIALVLEQTSPATANNQFRSLQQFFKYLEAEEEIPNPMTGMKPPRIPEKLVPVITEDEWSKLIGTCNTKHYNDVRDRAILEFFRSTGARRAEVSGLRVSDLDIQQLAAVVTGKASKMRIVRFDAATALAISRYLRVRKAHEHSSSEYLWLGKKGPLTDDGIYQMFGRRGKRAGVGIHPHQLRHTLAHRYLLNGGSEGDLMQQAGWSSSQMLRRYGASAAAERARSHYDKVMGK